MREVATGYDSSIHEVHRMATWHHEPDESWAPWVYTSMSAMIMSALCSYVYVASVELGVTISDELPTQQSILPVWSSTKTRRSFSKKSRTLMQQQLSLHTGAESNQAEGCYFWGSQMTNKYQLTLLTNEASGSTWQVQPDWYLRQEILQLEWGRDLGTQCHWWWPINGQHNHGCHHLISGT